MASTLSLPNELILHLYETDPTCETSPTFETAFRLSATNSRLRCIWCTHADWLIEERLKPAIPAYSEASDLAIKETRDAQLLDTNPPLRPHEYGTHGWNPSAKTGCSQLTTVKVLLVLPEQASTIHALLSYLYDESGFPPPPHDAEWRDKTNLPPRIKAYIAGHK